MWLVLFVFFVGASECCCHTDSGQAVENRRFSVWRPFRTPRNEAVLGVPVAPATNRTTGTLGRSARRKKKGRTGRRPSRLALSRPRFAAFGLDRLRPARLRAPHGA
jgi:hypothetical protein